MAGVWFVKLVFDSRDAAFATEELFSEEIVAASIMERQGTPFWDVMLQFDDKPEETKLRGRLGELAAGGEFSITIEQDKGTDWVARYRENTKPVTAGRFFVYPSHHQPAPPDGTIPIRMDAGLAFGTGDHETTKGCLRALDRLAAGGVVPQRAIDLGCGTAILAIAMRLLWPDVKILATDIDAVAIETSEANIRDNDVEGTIDTLVSDGWPEGAYGPFDLAAANILSGPLIDMAGDAAAHMSPGGWLVLSGILCTQAQDVVDAYQAAGFSLENRDDEGEWATLLMRRN